MDYNQIPLDKFVDIVAVAVTLCDDQLLDFLIQRFVIDDFGARRKASGHSAFTRSTVGPPCKH